MTHFPITKSYLATAALADRLEEEYDLANVRSRLISATLRDVHLVTTSRRRFIFEYLYAFLDQSLERLERTMEQLAHRSAAQQGPPPNR